MAPIRIVTQTLVFAVLAALVSGAPCLAAQSAGVQAAAVQSASAAPGSVSVTFRMELPGTVRRVAVYEAQSDPTQPSVVVVPQGSQEITVAFEAGRDAVVQFDLDGGAYLLDGPFRWPAETATHVVAHAPKRTVAGRLTSRAELDRPVWIDASARVSSEPWPQCGASERMWACVGVPADESGLVVFSADHPVLFAYVPARGAPVMQSAAWATVVVAGRNLVDDLSPPGNDGALKVQLWRSTDPSVLTSGARIVPEAARGCRVLALGPRAFVVGCSVADDVDVQVHVAGAAMVRTTIDAASAWLLSAVEVELAHEIVVSGKVETSQGRPAPGARIDISQIVDARDVDGTPRTMRRSVAEATATDDGRFEVRGLGPGRYEALAAHARLGRGRVRFAPDARQVVVRLAPTSRVVGRVVRRGVPVVGAVVDAPPDPAAYLKAADPFDVITPETATGADGGFELSLAPGGATEVRIVQDRVTVRRPIAGARAGLIDLGDVEWPAAVVVALDYAGDERCTVIAIGPLGRSGIATVEATIVAPGARRLVLPEAGSWVVGARCGVRELPVQPGTIDVPHDAPEWRAHLTVLPRVE